MAINFRLEAMQAGKYLDLFPKTTLQAIIDGADVLQVKTLNVNIPVPSANETTQTIDIVTDDKMVDSPFEVYLINDTEEAKKSYSTIHQVEIQKNSLIVTRLQEMPKVPIDVTIIFFEAGTSINKGN